MICSECEADKGTGEFYKDNSRPRGRVARCKTCYAAKQKVSRFFAPRRFSEHKFNAAKRKVEWLLTFEEYMAWIWGAPCYFCRGESNGGMDRLNNEPFYSLKSVVPCCGRCNGMKSGDGLNEFLTRVGVIAEHLLGMTANAAIALDGKL
jgi:hypothetical protein